MNLDYLEEMHGGPTWAERVEALERRVEALETEALRLHLHEHGFGPEYTDDATYGVMDEAHRTLFPACREWGL